MKHKKLTLIELIITIMVLGLLAALAIPQFTGVKANADVASFKNDIDTLAKAMDESFIKDDNLPLGEKVTITDPALLDAIYATGDSGTDLYKIDLSKSSKYHSKLKTKIDVDHYFIYSMETSKVFYTKAMINAEGQTLYTMEYIGLSGVKIGSQTLLNGMSLPVSEPAQTITGQVPVASNVEVSVNGTSIPVTTEDIIFEGKTNLMAATKYKTFTSEAVLSEGKNIITIKVDSSVTNFNINLGNEASTPVDPTPVIKPVAVISMTPEQGLTTATPIIWNYDSSTTASGRTIISVQWEGKQDIYSTEGNYTVRLKVQDSTGVWSDWTEKIIEVKKNYLVNANNFTLSTGATKTGDIFSVDKLAAIVNFGDFVDSGIYYMEFKSITSLQAMFGVITPNTLKNNYFLASNSKTLYYNGYIYKPSSSNISMPFTTNSVIGIKLDMDNKQVTFYVGSKTYTTPLEGSSYSFYATSGSSTHPPITFTINTDPNTFVYNPGINF